MFVSGFLVCTRNDIYGGIPVIVFHIARIGLSLVTNAPLNVEVDAKTHAAVGIARAFSFISSDKDTRQAFDWLIAVSDAIGPFICMNSYRATFFLRTLACLLIFSSEFMVLQFHTSPKTNIVFVLAL